MNNILQIETQKINISDIFSSNTQESKQKNNVSHSSSYRSKSGVKWQQLLTRISIWLAIEVFLNFIGLDTLADYSEFIYQKNTIIHLL